MTLAGDAQDRILKELGPFVEAVKSYLLGTEDPPTG